MDTTPLDLAANAYADAFLERGTYQGLWVGDPASALGLTYRSIVWNVAREVFVEQQAEIDRLTSESVQLTSREQQLVIDAFGTLSGGWALSKAELAVVDKFEKHLSQ